MENLEWQCETEVLTLDSGRRQIIRCNITDNPHESIESYESFEDFLLDKRLTSMSIKANFSKEIYEEILKEIRNRGA